MLDQEKNPGWVWSPTTPIIWLPDPNSQLLSNVLGASTPLPCKTLQRVWQKRAFFCRSGLVHSCWSLSGGLTLFGVNFQQPERRVCHSHFREMVFPRPWRDLVHVPDIRQRCYQPSQPILAHARARMKESCRWANRGTGRTSSQLHPIYTLCSFNNFGANYFYKSFQVSWKHTKTCKNGWVCHYQVGQFLSGCSATFSRVDWVIKKVFMYL